MEGGDQHIVKRRRSLLLWAFVVWLLALGTISVWRGVVLSREGALVIALGSRLVPAALVFFVASWILCGAGLAISALGLWCWREWARQSARVLIPVYFGLSQFYTWAFARSGLIWARRWISLISAVLATGISVAALSWRRSRRWLGLE